jgi:hypothetical protein
VLGYYNILILTPRDTTGHDYQSESVYFGESENMMRVKFLDDQTRGCAAQNETEARATHCPVSGRQHQQTQRGGDGATVEPDGAVARPAGHVYRQARGRPGWKQTAHPIEL